MKVLVACEYSGIVRTAFALKGHEAWSCDMLDTELPGNHYKGDVRDLLNDPWDLMIAHPPCTFLCRAQIHLSLKDPVRAEKSQQALDFVKTLLWCPIPRVVIENPGGLIGSRIKPPDQTIQPYMFGDAYRKDICLWLKGVPPLKIPPPDQWNNMRKSVANHTNGRMSAEEKSKIKSRFFHYTAAAMADQWSF